MGSRSRNGLGNFNCGSTCWCGLGQRRRTNLVCKLNTRTTILAATNPKGQYDPHESVSVNIALGSPLLSRFDLVLVLLDTKNEDWDSIISSFILENKGYPSKSEKLWSMEKMKTYFCLIRNLQPTLSDVGNQVLLRYYQMQRQSDSRNAARTTIRLLESLIRLAEAHARLMFRDTVTVEDAITAVSVMESSMQGGALLGGVNALHTSFPENPLEQYQRQCELILEKLELYDILSEELRRLERLQNQSQQQEVEVQMTPRPMSNDPGREPAFQTSTQQEINCCMRMSPTGGTPGESPHPSPPPFLEPKISTNRKHSAERKDNRDDSLDWFDSVSTHQIEPESTVTLLPKTARGKVPSNISSHKFQGKKKNEPAPGNPLETEHSSAPEETETVLKLHNVEGKETPVVSEDAPTDELGSVLTHRAPRKLHKLRKGRSQELSKNPTRAPSQPTDPFPQTSPVQNPGRTLDTPKRKRHKLLVQEEEHKLESIESSGPPVAKLAKFTFKQKSKLIHSPEDNCVSPSTSKITTHNPKVSHHRRGTALPMKGLEKLMLTSENRSSHQLQDEVKEVSCQPPEKDGSREKREHVSEERVVHPDLEFENETGLPHLTCGRDRREEVSCSSTSSKIHARTLAKLAHFSFTSPSDSKFESPHPPPPESKSHSERGLSSPPTTLVSVVGSKRRTFQLEGSSNKSTLSKQSLFSISELDDEALDFDWDEEIRKKPKL